jgi:hypothetical protein
MSDTSRTPRLALLALALGLAAGGFAPARAQDTPAPAQGAQQRQPGDEDETRQIKSSNFTKNRPAPKASTSAGAPKSSGAGGDSASWNAPTYHRVKPSAAPVRRRPSAAKPKNTAAATKKKTDPAPANLKPGNPLEVRDVGVTLWRLRPAKETDTGPGFQVLQAGKLVVMTPERIEGTAPVALGESVRLSIESPRDGYLYVINREQYADGATGAPALIFPTTRIRGGDNRVSAGRLVDIPDAGDRTPFFTLTSNRRDGQPQNVGELLTILITPRPLEGVAPGRDPVALDPAQVAKWEADWEGEVSEMLEMNGGAGRVWTQEEKQAGEATRSLTQVDPGPQTIYRVSGRPGEPLMLTVQMIYGASATAPAPQAGATPPQP